MLQMRDYDLDNYSTDENMVAVAIELTNWNRMDLADIQGEIVQSYDLERRKQAAAIADASDEGL